MEQYSTARHHLKFYFNAAISATYTLPDPFTLPVRDYVYRACEFVIKKHPILSAIPIGEDTNEPYFARLPEVDLEHPISFQNRNHAFPEANGVDVELEALLNVQHNTPYSAPFPYWRLCVLIDTANERRFTAAYVFHHAISDGTSGKVFHRAFLEGLHTAATSAETRQVVSSPEMPLLPNLEAVHPMPLSLPYLATVLFREKVWSSRDPGLWTGSEIRVPLETQMRHIVIPKSVATSLKNCCRQHNTTITAALQTIISRSFFTHLPTNFSKLQCQSALSTRRWLPDIINEDSMGVWVQDFDETYTRDDLTGEPFPWAEATRTRQTIENVLSLEGKNASPNLLKYVNDYQQTLLSKIGKQRGSSLEVSNVGVFTSDLASSDSSERPQIGRMLFSQCASLTGSAVEVSAITGVDGCMVLAFSWQTEVVELELISAVIESTEKELHSLAQ